MPAHYIVKLNSLCNLNCCFCADSIEARGVPDFKYDALIKGLERNRQLHDSLIISGGEPTIYPNLLPFLHHAKKVCGYKRISLTTNGVMLSSQKNADALIHAGVDARMDKGIRVLLAGEHHAVGRQGNPLVAADLLRVVEERQEIRIDGGLPSGDDEGIVELAVALKALDERIVFEVRHAPSLDGVRAEAAVQVAEAVELDDVVGRHGVPCISLSNSNPDAI